MNVVVIQQEEKSKLTMPPNRASWSSATISTMLLSLLRGSAHLTQQVSSVRSSATAARCCSPFRPLADHPGELVRPSIGASEALTRSHKHRHAHSREVRLETQFRFPL